MSEEDLARATLDTFPINVAVLDADGEIVLTNSAWRSFAHREGGVEDHEELGTDYLAAADVDDDDARAAVEGIEAVLAGDRDEFELEYPCHSPEEQRWFLMRVSPVQVAGERGAVVAHANITDRKRAELTAGERADQLQHLLDRVDGLLQEVTTAVVAARSRPAIETGLCEALVKTAVYTFAWIGRPDLRTESLVPRAWCGEGPDDVEARSLSLSTDAPAARAYRTGQLQVVTGLEDGLVDQDRWEAAGDDGTGVATSEGATGGVAAEDVDATSEAAKSTPEAAESTGESAESAGEEGEDHVAADGASAVEDGDDDRWGPVPGARSLAAVPIAYRETRYGVLSVYADDPDALDTYECTVLRALGEVVATAVHAVASGRVLESSSVVELDVAFDAPDSYLTALPGTDGTLQHHDAHVDEDGAVRTYVTVTGTDTDEVLGRATGHPDVASCRRLAEREDGALFELVVTAPLVAALADFDGVTTALSGSDGRVEATVTFPDETAARAAFEHLQERHDRLELSGYRDRERPTDTAAGFRASLEESLTERQLTALRMAYYSGYFEWPRDVSGEEVADAMDITRATFHQHLREAQRKLTEALLESGS